MKSAKPVASSDQLTICSWNNLTSDPNDYMALVQPTGVAELDDIIERIIQQGSTVVKADTL